MEFLMELFLLPFHRAPNEPGFKSTAVSALPKLSGTVRSPPLFQHYLQGMGDPHFRAW